MIHGIGIDLIEIDRIRKAIERHPRFLSHVFTEREIVICNGKGDPAASFAGRFAAKEAVIKAVGMSLYWHEIEILCDDEDKPIPLLHGRAAPFAELGNVMVSISHTRTNAVAQAIIIQNPQNPNTIPDESW